MLECGKLDESATYLTHYFKETENGETGKNIYIFFYNFPTVSY
jgi:hypothetical protein